MKRHDEHAWRKASTPPPGYQSPEPRSADPARARPSRVAAALRSLLLRREAS